MMKDIHCITSTGHEENNGYTSGDSNESDSAETSTSSQETFFVVSFKTTKINKVTEEEEQKPFLIDLPITTEKHHKWKHVLHLKAVSGAQKSIMTKNSPMHSPEINS